MVGLSPGSSDAGSHHLFLEYLICPGSQRSAAERQCWPAHSYPATCAAGLRLGAGRKNTFKAEICSHKRTPARLESEALGLNTEKLSSLAPEEHLWEGEAWFNPSLRRENEAASLLPRPGQRLWQCRCDSLRQTRRPYAFSLD